MMGKLKRDDLYSTTVICKKLNLVVSSEFIRVELGVEPEILTWTGIYWLKTDFPAICKALAEYANKKALESDGVRVK